MRIANQELLVVRWTKTAEVRTHQSFYLVSMIEDGNQPKQVVAFVLVANQVHIQKINRTHVPRTARLHQVPATVPTPHIGVAFLTTPIKCDRVATNGAHGVDPADVVAICVFRLLVRISPVHCLGMQHSRQHRSTFWCRHRVVRGTDTCIYM